MKRPKKYEKLVRGSRKKADDSENHNPSYFVEVQVFSANTCYEFLN